MRRRANMAQAFYLGPAFRVEALRVECVPIPCRSFDLIHCAIHSGGNARDGVTCRFLQVRAPPERRIFRPRYCQSDATNICPSALRPSQALRVDSRSCIRATHVPWTQVLGANVARQRRDNRAAFADLPSLPKAGLPIVW